jgi:sigma-B regulation protein RsbU (phosphoserine phosphatase)
MPVEEKPGLRYPGKFSWSAGVPFLAFLILSTLWLTCVAVMGQDPPERNGRPPHGLPFDHSHIHPPTGKSPAAGTPVIFDASGLGSPVLLDHNWRLGIAPGTEPAEPSFDDSQWPIRDAKDALAEVNDPDSDRDDGPHGQGPQDKDAHHPPGRPFAWFRIHVQLPEHHGRLVVLVRLPVTRSSQLSFNTGTVGMDLFANGKLVVPEGPNGGAPEGFQQISRIYPINIPENDTSLTMAVRIPFVPFGMDAYTGFFANRTFILGEREDLGSHLDLWYHSVLFERIPGLIDGGLKLLLAVFLLALFWTQKDHQEYLWLGLHMVFVAPLPYLAMVGGSAQLDRLWVGALTLQFLLISAYFYFEFLAAFLTLRTRWYIKGLRYTSPLLLLAGPLLLMIRHGDTVAIGLVVAMCFVFAWVSAWMLFIGITLTVAAIKRNYEAALLLLPLLLSVVGTVELASTASASSWVSTPVQSPLTFQAGPIPIHFSDFADFVGVLVIILIIFVRFQRIHRERERASSELAAARSVQELMIPRESPATPGFHVDTVYNPATEVGGDFFHIQATSGGGLIIVIGDVAGHGLQAAMNVSMLMGALRRSPDASPAEMLSGLNRVLVGSSSLTTCQVAYFSDNGELTVASAGHPPPYLNSQEITLPGGLPLGVVPDVAYEETKLYLHPGDRLLMVSDGVIEARKPSGEMFGFDRVRNLSSQSAFFIADAAKDFGQEDDITVLTVRRLNQAAVA